MGIEIERKYLVKDTSFIELAKAKEEIYQGYLNRNPERTVRVRIKGNKGFITVKSRNIGMSRKEFEYEIPYADAIELLKLCELPVIHKYRYQVEYDDKLWEVDRFDDEKDELTVAEIELASEDEEFSIPPFIGIEVTGDPKYYNSNL